MVTLYHRCGQELRIEEKDGFLITEGLDCPGCGESEIKLIDLYAKDEYEAEFGHPPEADGTGDGQEPELAPEPEAAEASEGEAAEPEEPELCEDERQADAERELAEAQADLDAECRQPELPTMDTVRSTADDWWEATGELIAMEKQSGPLEVRVEQREGGRAVTVTGPIGRIGRAVITQTLILRPETADILRGMLDRAVKAAKV